MKNFLSVIALLCYLVVTAQAKSNFNFQLVDGITNKVLVRCDAKQTTASSAGISLQQSFEGTNNEQPSRWEIKVKNTSSGDRRFYFCWEVSWDGNPAIEQLHYWSGKGEVVTGNALLQAPSSDASMNTSMLQAIYDGSQGIALALSPFEIVTQFEQALKSESGRAGTDFSLSLKIPLVLNAGQEDSFPVEIYRFKPRYGFLDALQLYYAAHPDAFNPRRDIDPRAAGVGTHTSWVISSFEATRRQGGQWDWCYAPFRRTGDIYGRDELWNYTPARPFNQSRRVATAAEYREKRRKLFEDGNAAGAAMAFYVPSFLYCEEQLAKERYPDAIVYKPDNTYARYYNKPWVTGQDNEVLVYPWANSFAEQSMADAHQLVAENDITAFGYDVMAGGFAYRGSNVRKSPRRAFDAEGEYVDVAVAIAKMMDFTRSLEKDGKKVGVVGNPTGNSRPFLVARSDSAMFEQPPYSHAEELTALRYTMGHKAITWWTAWRLHTLLKWQEMTPDQLRAAYLAASNYLRLASYRYGGYPSSSWTKGAPQIVQMLPLLKEVIGQGWQAVPAVRATNGSLPSTVWPARYGTGPGSYLTIGNADKTPWSGPLVIDNDYIGLGNYLFVDVTGKPLRQTVQGRTTILQVEIPAQETLVLRAIATLPVNASGAATTNWSNDGATAHLQIQTALPVEKVAAPRDGWDAGKRQGQSWTFTSHYLATPQTEVENFPFFTETATAPEAVFAQIVLPDKPTADEKWAAAHIQGYFQFWGKEGLKPAREINLPIVQGPAGANTGLPSIVIGGKADKVRRDSSTLFVGGKDLRATTLALLAALDHRYFYTGTFPERGGIAAEAEVVKKAGLAGQLLMPAGP